MLASHALIGLKGCRARAGGAEDCGCYSEPDFRSGVPVLSAEISAFVVVPLRLAIAPAMVDGRGVQSLQPAIEILASHGRFCDWILSVG